MHDYQVVFSRFAQKELEALTIEAISRITSKIEDLTLEPRPDGCKKLKGSRIAGNQSRRLSRDL